jgi:hypothetical protein
MRQCKDNRLNVGNKILPNYAKTMQKLWFTSKRSQPLPSEEAQTGASPLTPTDPSSNESEEKVNEVTNADQFPSANSEKGLLKYLWQSPKETTPKTLNKPFAWQISPAWLLLALGVGGVVFVTALGLQYLTTTESTPDSKLSCKLKISGDWQTPFGTVTLREEDSDLISGKYEYVNLERGKIAGELTGKLSNNVVAFSWQETPNHQAKQEGKGFLVFGDGCKEFYGSYGTGDSTNNFGNWQGSRVSK